MVHVYCSRRLQLSRVIAKSYERPYPTCTLPTDSFHLPTINISIPLSFAYCRPSKFSLDTLGASGSALGLAPSEHLRQTKSMSILKQLLQKQIIERPVFSLMLINGQEGVLSVGGTGARAVEMVEQQTKDELDHVSAVERGELTTDFEGDNIIKRSMTMQEPVFDTKANWEEGWKWSQVQGAEGWWQILMQGVWVDGSKVLQNQAAVIDVRFFPLAFSATLRERKSRITDYPYHRLTALSSSLLHSQPKLSTPPSPARAHYPLHTRISTCFPVSTRPSCIWNSPDGISRSCRAGVVPTGQGSREAGSAWAGLGMEVVIVSVQSWSRGWE